MSINTASHASHQKVMYTVGKGAQLPRRSQLAISDKINDWDTFFTDFKKEK